MYRGWDVDKCTEHKSLEQTTFGFLGKFSHRTKNAANYSPLTWHYATPTTRQPGAPGPASKSLQPLEADGKSGAKCVVNYLRHVCCAECGKFDSEMHLLLKMRVEQPHEPVLGSPLADKPTNYVSLMSAPMERSRRRSGFIF